MTPRCRSSETPLRTGPLGVSILWRRELSHVKRPSNLLRDKVPEIWSATSLIKELLPPGGLLSRMPLDCKLGRRTFQNTVEDTVNNQSEGVMEVSEDRCETWCANAHDKSSTCTGGMERTRHATATSLGSWTDRSRSVCRQVAI